MGDLLKEAIADAKAVRETALQNAKMALEEAFTPQLKSMLSAKLKEEEGVPHDEEEVGDGMDDDEVDTDVVDAEGGSDGEADDSSEEQAPSEPSATAGEDEESGVPGSQEETEYEEETGDGMDEDEVPAEGEELNQEGMEEEETEEDEEMDEGALDLEAIIRELEDEVGEEEAAEEGEYEETEDAEEMAMKDEEEVPAEEAEAEEMAMKDEDEEAEEELEVDENLWKEEDEADDDDDDDDDDDMDESKLHAELKEYKAAVKFLKDKLHEVNILNAKLLFTNKLFKEFALNNNQKLKVVETFDRAQTTREIKLVYSTLAEQFSDNGSINKKSISESASRPVASTKPKKKIISESAQVANRFKKLAGLIK